MFGRSAESLQKDKIQNLEREMESQKKLFCISIISLEKLILKELLAHVLQEIEFKYVETKVLVSSKLFSNVWKIQMQIRNT